jgi:hypothetical protein
LPVPDDRIDLHFRTINDLLERIWKKAVVEYIKILNAMGLEGLKVTNEIIRSRLELETF